MPHRVIVEPNEPRHGFSNMTWQGLNHYYLQKSLEYKDYEEILEMFKKTAFRAYSINREENFTQDFPIRLFTNFVYLFDIITIGYIIWFESWGTK